MGTRSSKSEKNISKAGRIFNSTVAYICTYAIFDYVYFLAPALMAKVFNFSATVYFYGNRFDLKGQEWTRLKITFVFISGLIAGLLLTGVCTFLFSKYKGKGILITLLTLWGSVVGCAFFCAQGMIANLGANVSLSPFYHHLSVVYSWFYTPDPIVYLFSIPFFALLVFVGYYVGKPFLSLSYSYSKVNKPSRKRKYFLETAIVPFILGSLLILIFILLVYDNDSQSGNNWLNKFLQLTTLNFAFIFILLLMALAWTHVQDISVDSVLRLKTLQTPNLFLVGVLAIVVIFLALVYKGLLIS